MEKHAAALDSLGRSVDPEQAVPAEQDWVAPPPTPPAAPLAHGASAARLDPDPTRVISVAREPEPTLFFDDLKPRHGAPDPPTPLEGFQPPDWLLAPPPGPERRRRLSSQGLLPWLLVAAGVLAAIAMTAALATIGSRTRTTHMANPVPARNHAASAGGTREGAVGGSSGSPAASAPSVSTAPAATPSPAQPSPGTPSPATPSPATAPSPSPAAGPAATGPGTAATAPAATPGGAPVISSISPDGGASGQQVTLTGSNFFSSDGSITVLFGGAQSPVSCPTQTTCSAVVPAGIPARPGQRIPVTMSTSSGTSAPVPFTYGG